MPTWWVKIFQYISNPPSLLSTAGICAGGLELYCLPILIHRLHGSGCSFHLQPSLTSLGQIDLYLGSQNWRLLLAGYLLFDIGMEMVNMYLSGISQTHAYIHMHTHKNPEGYAAKIPRIRTSDILNDKMKM